MHRRHFVLSSLTLAAVHAFTPGRAQMQSSLPEVPVRVGGDPDLDACGALGEVSGLDPAGDHFLSLRSGPGARYAELARLHTGQRLWLCEQRGLWLGVIFGPDDTDCSVSSPSPGRRPYRGPCRSGWVHERYVTLLAG